jgi:hypothetical protein
MGETDFYCGNDMVSFLAREATARCRAANLIKFVIFDSGLGFK